MSLLLLFLPSSGGLQNYGYTSVGGDVNGGTAVMLRSAGIISSGGDINGGTATYIRNAGKISSGGDINGGDAIVVGTLGRSGTVVTQTPLPTIFILPDNKPGIYTGAGSTYYKV